MNIKITLALFAALVFVIPANAGAHITLQPDEVTVGEFTALQVRVPNEGAGPATTKVSVHFPPGFFYALYQAVPGWSVKVKTRKPPSSEVREITWTADSARAGIPPGQFQDFPIGVSIPAKAGDTLTFRAIQTYGNGAVVRWTGAPETQEPAPQVVVTGGGDDRNAVASKTSEADDSDNDGDGLAIAALVVGVVALLLGAAALLFSTGAISRSRRDGDEAVEGEFPPPSQLRLEDALEEVDREQDEDDDDQDRDNAHGAPSGRE